jgi:hypothetical protein
MTTEQNPEPTNNNYIDRSRLFVDSVVLKRRELETKIQPIATSTISSAALNPEEQQTLDKLVEENRVLKDELRKVSLNAEYGELKQEIDEMRALLALQFNDKSFISMLAEAGVNPKHIDDVKQDLSSKQQGNFAALYIAKNFAKTAFDFALGQNKVKLHFFNLADELTRTYRKLAPEAGLDPELLSEKQEFTASNVQNKAEKICQAMNALVKAYEAKAESKPAKVMDIIRELENEDIKKFKELTAIASEILPEFDKAFVSRPDYNVNDDEYDKFKKGLNFVSNILNQLKQKDAELEQLWQWKRNVVECDYPVYFKELVKQAAEETNPESLMTLIMQIEGEAEHEIMTSEERDSLNAELRAFRGTHLEIIKDKIKRASRFGEKIDTEIVIDTYLADFEKVKEMHKKIDIELGPDYETCTEAASLLVDAIKKETKQKKWYNLLIEGKIPKHTESYMERLYLRAGLVQEIAKYTYSEEDTLKALKDAVGCVQKEIAERAQMLFNNENSHEAKAEKAELDKLTAEFKLDDIGVFEQYINEQRARRFYAKNKETLMGHVAGFRYEDAANLCRKQNAGNEMKYFCKLKSMLLKTKHAQTGVQAYHDAAHSFAMVAEELGYLFDEPEALKETMNKLEDVLIS